MSTYTERIVAYILGACAGFAASVFLTSFSIPIFNGQNTTFLSVVCVIIGVLVSIVLVEYKNYILMKSNNMIRNETVALITHEMRTSLTSSGWMIGLILKKYNQNLEVSDREMLQAVIDSIHATVMHSVNLLDISLLDIKKLNIALEWVTLDKVEKMFQEVVQKYTLGASEKKIVLVSDIQLDDTKMAEVDLLRLRIVLENLLENALQYCKDDKGQITVTISNNTNEIKIIVQDTGMGIPENEQEKIFSEFFRASNARKILSTGSGIGLYTSSTYIKAHRGKMWFESKEGEGTTFYVTVPLKSVADVEGFIQKI